MERESCRICGGDGRVGNAFGGSATTCPSCNGTGRRNSSDTVFRDVTKTKASHHLPSVKPGTAPVKSNVPTTFDGVELAKEITASGVSADVKARLIHEIVEYEGSHGKCTQTFTKKIRKQIRPRTG
jgi:hypothetical protein